MASLGWKVLTSQEGLCCMELVSQCFMQETERQTIRTCDLGCEEDEE
jgi:hypothetical protein